MKAFQNIKQFLYDISDAYVYMYTFFTNQIRPDD